MGCDIHGFLEVKIDGTWHVYGNPKIARDYYLFAQLAGVRNYDNITPISVPRGLPEDCSVVVQKESDRWADDGHSHSWVTMAELATVVGDKERRQKSSLGTDCPLYYGGWDYWEFGYLCGNSPWNYVKYPEDFPEYIQDVRFVFWFDN